MADYLLHVDHLDGNRDIPPLPITGAVPGDLAQAVHRHVRGHLGSRRVDVTLDAEGLTGTVWRHGTTVGAFHLTAVDECAATSAEPRPGEVRHGYTLTDIQRLTHLTIHLDRWHTAGDVDERCDAVWFAIVEHLLTTDTAPTRSDLVRVGTEASDALVRDEMRTHGRCTQNVGQPMPRFHAYWNPTRTPSPEPRVVERHALGQIWPLLRRASSGP